MRLIRYLSDNEITSWDDPILEEALMFFYLCWAGILVIYSIGLGLLFASLGT